jgi:hypothetical protein
MLAAGVEIKARRETSTEGLRLRRGWIAIPDLRRNQVRFPQESGRRKTLCALVNPLISLSLKARNSNPPIPSQEMSYSFVKE